MLKISWPSSDRMEIYDKSKCAKVANFYVPTCPIFAGAVTYYNTTIQNAITNQTMYTCN